MNVKEELVMKKMMLQIAGADEKNPSLQVEVADSFCTRLRGLMGRKSLPAGKGLLIAPCSSIHMCFMRFAIDVIYIDQDYRVLKMVYGLKPWTGLSICWKAWGVIEFQTGLNDFSNIHVGDYFKTNQRQGD